MSNTAYCPECLGVSEYDEVTFDCLGCGCVIVDVERQEKMRTVASLQEAVAILLNYAESLPTADDDVINAAFITGRLQGLVDAAENRDEQIAEILEANDLIVGDVVPA